MKNYDLFLIFAQNIEMLELIEGVLMSTHNLCFRAEKIMNTTVCPSFTILKWDLSGEGLNYMGM